MGKLDIPRVSKKQAVTSVLESIAAEESSIARIINAEVAKVKVVAKKLGAGKTKKDNYYNEIIEFQKSVNQIFKLLIEMQMLLQFKTESIISILDMSKDCKKEEPIIYGNPEDCF